LALVLAACEGNKPAVAVTVGVVPAMASLQGGKTQQFAADVKGTTNTAVIWSVDEAGGGSVADGLYTAPNASGTYHVRATSVAEPAQSGSAAVTVTALPDVAVTVLPANVNLQGGGTQQLAAVVTGTTNTAVVWSVDEAGGGSVTGVGLYTAPTAMGGAFHVRATSVADATRSGTALITVTALPMVTVSLSPMTVTLTGGATQQFTATVTGSANTAVSWTAEGGSISATGLFTAPTTPGTVHVTATAVADPTRSATSTVTVTEQVGVTVSPTAAALIPGGTQTFVATVTGSTNTGVSWGTSGGAITDGGVYTAPPDAGVYSVTATALANPARSASAMVTVTPVTVSLNPPTANLNPGGTFQFTATVTGSTNTAVTWTATGGMVNSGLYTAGATTGVFSVTATSVADPTKSASSTVTISNVLVVINPRTTTVQAGTTKQFQVTVTGTANTSVTWSVPNSLNGTISSSGLYTAPVTPGTYSVTVASVADASRTDTATITVQAAPIVSVSITNPTTTPTVNQGATQGFTAAVTGSTNTTVVWSVSGGVISTGGVFTAPTGATAPGTYTVTATSVADATKTATAQVIVPAVAVTLSPKTPTLFTQNLTGATPTTQQFTATVTGALNTQVTWSIVEGAVGGTIGTGGAYSAPPAAGSFTVLARSVIDTTKQDTASVTVNPAPIVVSISPTSVSVPSAGQQHFTASAANSDGGVVFSVTAGGVGGAVDPFGNYTAPTTGTGTDFVVATSQQDPTKTAQATVVVCNVGVSCTPPGNACKVGTYTCSGAGQTCTQQAANMPNGTACGTNQVCNNGTCSACVAGATCTPSDTCATGVTSCATGVSTCIPSGPNPTKPNGAACGVNAPFGTCQNGACTCGSGNVFVYGDCNSCPSFTNTTVTVNADPAMGIDDACCGRQGTTRGLGGPCLTVTQAMKNITTTGWNIAVTPDSLHNLNAAEHYPLSLSKGVRVDLSSTYLKGVANQPVIVVNTDTARVTINGSGSWMGVDSAGVPSGASEGIYVGPTAGGAAAVATVNFLSVRNVSRGAHVDSATASFNYMTMNAITNEGVLCRSDTAPGSTTTLESVYATQVTSANTGLFMGKGCVSTNGGGLNVGPTNVTTGVCPVPRTVQYGVWLEGNAQLTMNGSTINCANVDGVSLRSNPALATNNPLLTMTGATLRYNGCAGLYVEAGRATVASSTLRNNHFGVWLASGGSGADPLLSPVLLNPGVSARNHLLCNTASTAGACSTGAYANKGFSVFNNSGYPIDADGNYWGESPITRCTCDPTLATCGCSGFAVAPATPPDLTSVVNAPLNAATTGTPSTSVANFALDPNPTCP
jgi:hypothetical protein